MSDMKEKYRWLHFWAGSGKVLLRITMKLKPQRRIGTIQSQQVENRELSEKGNKMQIALKEVKSLFKEIELAWFKC